ncbi:Flp pilus assembly protein CpaB [Altererythrobacter aquiaggeris]|uniref:Flp pilus assembly protein CpaB n=1 Tax=Aestuarierythrobacter aquiaggeris TaxID=1898396 RepID=UPI003018197D
MERRNLIIIGAAIILGLFAVYVANAWFSGVEQRQERIAEQQQMARIAVARQDLPFGAPLTADNVRLVNWPAQSVPAGAYRDVARLLAGNNVAIRPIANGEPILRSRISERAVLSENIPDDLRAITVPINEVSGVAGFVTPGDVVDVLLTRQIPGDGATGDDKMTSVVLENVQVLAVDRRSNEGNTEVVVSKTATLQVDQRGAQKLALAVDVGRLSLALRNVENQTVGTYATVTTRDLGGSGIFMAGQREPAPVQASAPVYVYPPQGAGPPSSAPRASTATVRQRPSGPTMTVTRGTETTNTEVQRYGRY